MRKLFIILLVLLVALVSVVPVFAHNAGPCNDTDGDGSPSGNEYAQHHIVPADLGSGGHIPGTHHGFSLCIPQAGWK